MVTQWSIKRLNLCNTLMPWRQVRVIYKFPHVRCQCWSKSTSPSPGLSRTGWRGWPHQTIQLAKCVRHHPTGEDIWSLHHPSLLQGQTQRQSWQLIIFRRFDSDVLRGHGLLVCMVRRGLCCRPQCRPDHRSTLSTNPSSSVLYVRIKASHLGL